MIIKDKLSHIFAESSDQLELGPVVCRKIKTSWALSLKHIACSSVIVIARERSEATACLHFQDIQPNLFTEWWVFTLIIWSPDSGGLEWAENFIRNVLCLLKIYLSRSPQNTDSLKGWFRIRIVRENSFWKFKGEKDSGVLNQCQVKYYSAVPRINHRFGKQAMTGMLQLVALKPSDTWNFFYL